MRPNHPQSSGSAYSLIEILVAAAILAMGVVASGAMALTIVGQQEANARVSRALNLQEQAARLYQLGLDPASIPALLPPDPAVVSLEIAGETLVEVGPGATVQVAEIDLVFRSASGGEVWSPGEWVAGGSPADRAETVVAVRPTIR